MSALDDRVNAHDQLCTAALLCVYDDMSLCDCGGREARAQLAALRETAERRLELLGRLLDKPMNFSRRTITMTIPPDLARALAEELKQKSISAE